LSAIEILDAFGQRSLLRFEGFATDSAPVPSRFVFTPPPGVDVLEQ
jgi:outer membrane lipoprotein carrier protein